MEKSETIKRVIEQYVNQENGLFLPDIQRHFVWKEEQIEKLFDSIMREYPIGSLLVWKSKEKIKTRAFINNYKIGDKLRTSKSDSQIKYLLLDGQQRIQSLFIALKGSYNEKELYFNILSGEKKHPEEISYIFKFMDDENAKFPWVKFKEIVLCNKNYVILTNELKKLADKDKFDLNDEKYTKLSQNVAQAQKRFTSDDVILSQKLDSVDQPELYQTDDIVEVFIRANSGGTQLNKSDLIFSLLISTWENAEESMDDLLAKLNKTGYNFSRDFVLKTCLTLLNKGARYNVDKVRESINNDEIMNNWKLISDSIKDVKDFLYSKTLLKSDKSIPSYLLYIPLVYFRYHYKDMWFKKDNLRIVEYILRTSLAGSFSGTPDNLIDKCIKQINDEKDFNVNSIFEVIKNDGRSINISREELLNLQYDSAGSHLLFNLWYKDFNYNPSYEGNKPQSDHIFPQSELIKHKEINPETGRNSIFKFPQNIRNQIANLALLTSIENGASGKLDTLPEEWFKDKDEKYLDMHLIPKDKNLWKVENFELFIKERKKLILEKFKHLLIQKEGQNE